MFKKPIWRIILLSFTWLISLGGLVVLMSFIEIKKAEVVCKDVKIYIPGSQYFIDKKEVENILQLSSFALIGRKIDQINLHNLENRLKANPFIEYAKVYADMDGIIMIEIAQREPILRVMNQFDQDYYIDKNGLKIPVSSNFTARVLAANGFIDEPFGDRVDTLHSLLAKDLFKTVSYIRKDSLWDAQIAQIYVNEGHEIELIPRVGNQRILLGSADSLELKFHNLKAFYKQALPQVGWDAYKVINIKYANQIIGVKYTKADSLRMKQMKITADSVKTVKQDTSLIKQ
ncbi:cell division protein FtsQ/DivIB [Mucilaginibacter sp. UR6-11]|uniref:cell division protein FtsQ/DivIB n=1 Tax=Mucilaginibacter sp. UR6-11 TaxID=1435644 RepID=UPI001E501DE7|nr:cell division protein FtsQ [Mucilaginibacter sp. UR6-11]MCC8424125.1 cell division protein FtsQ [Mucilaginibacter sp. UR6-11]